MSSVELEPVRQECMRRLPPEWIGNACGLLIESGLVLADNRGGRGLRFVDGRGDRLARRIGVAVVLHQGQPGLRLLKRSGGQD